MATVALTKKQAELLASLGFPNAVSTEMDDSQWFEIVDRLGDEIQLRCIDPTGSGINDRGELCRQILNAMADAESQSSGGQSNAC